MIILQKQLTSDRQRYTRARLAAKGNTTCSMAQSCYVNWQIIIPGDRFALSNNQTEIAAVNLEQTAIVRLNFNGINDPQADWARTMEVGAGGNQLPINVDEHIKEQAVIAANSLSDECTRNSVSVSSLESIVRERRNCGIFLEIPVSSFAATAGAFDYKIPEEITIAGVLDLNQLNLIFNSFPE
ncbi:MAG: hypothetical protein EZS28_002045 [Streblomastix strix]|uniref:Uncharacterized protein n=1 Tax=Streblomastix strix TaxID=222440 RepID=A0A5J4X581_9EUKA|nr:MAG: hypothetical protein EZS28_002045 [Streblomastix strix]